MHIVVALLVPLLLTACGALPPRPEQVASHAFAPSSDSPLDRIVDASTPASALSGFRLMPVASYALHARIELIRRATRSLDVQYYLIANDRTGRLFVRHLRDAARRGVRVRLLVDDLNTVGVDPMLSGLAAFPNVEVRLFNPFCCGRASLASRFAVSLMDFRRLNHRMHNKLFIADGVIAVVGGRNMADDYFARSAASHFIDMDLLVIGEVVPQLAAIFDVYWNSEQAYPINSIVADSLEPVARQASFDRLVQEGDQMTSVSVASTDMLGYAPIGAELDSGRLNLVWGSAVAFADQPRKVMATSMQAARAMSVEMDVMERVVLATREVVIASAYFVPGTSGVEAFASLRRRGVRVLILTNSFAANDVPLVYLGYARYRVSLLRAGVELYELSSTEPRGGGGSMFSSASVGRLHAKTAVLDQATVYIGSMNFDPRSENINTELGLIAHCPELAQDVIRAVDASRLRDSYQLRFGPDGASLQWLAMGEQHVTVFDSEPDVTMWMRFGSLLLGPFVPEQLL